MKIDVRVDLGDWPEKIAKQARFAAVKAVNATARRIVEAERSGIASVFDRPRPVTQRAVSVKQWAKTKQDSITAVVAVADGVSKTSGEAAYDAGANAQGKNAIPPSKYLAAEIQGGARVAKRFEVALQRANLMPKGSFAVFAKRSGALDQYGNLPGPKIVQILAWFRAFPENGYRMNMKDKTRNAIRKGKRKGMKHGMAYFRGGGKTGVPDGIWERHYPNGLAGKSFIRPVLIYVKAATYRVRFDFEGIAVRTAQGAWSDEYAQAFSAAMRTAR